MSGKIIITGAGRAGTSFLVQLLTRLGLDTGFEPGEEDFRDHWRAGCEITAGKGTFANPQSLLLQLEGLPRIIKSPDWSMCLKNLLRDGLMQVDHVFLPLRDSDESAQSRIDVRLYWHAKDPKSQAVVHRVAVGMVIEACVLYDVPCTLMRFPDLVQRARYTHRLLCRGLPELKHRWHEFNDIFQELQACKESSSPEDGEPASAD